MKYNTQNEKIKGITEKTLIIGIDIGSETHTARAFDWRGYEYSKKVFVFSNEEKGFCAFLEWMQQMGKANGKETFLPGMEPTGHYWFNLAYFLQEQGIRPVLVNPSHVKKAKELDDNHPTKTDQKDPKTIAGLLKEGRFSYPYLPKGVYAEVRELSNLRFQLQEELTRIQNRWHRWMNLHFPTYQKVFQDIHAKSGRMVLKQAPFPEEILQLGVEGVNQIWREAKLNGIGKKKAQALIQAAEQSERKEESPKAARMELQLLLEEYEWKEKKMEELLTQLEEWLKQIPYVEEVLQIKGIGWKTVSGFLAEVGEVSRFTSPKQIQKLAGLALVETSSGKKKGETRISKRGRKRLRHILFEAAIALVGKNEEFRELHHFYTTREENPLPKLSSILAIACKVIRIFYAIFTKGIVYDPEKMREDWKKSHS